VYDPRVGGVEIVLGEVEVGRYDEDVIYFGRVDDVGGPGWRCGIVE